jgi:ALIX V-shaped domain binding to HIV/BRO1-like domain
MNPNDGIDSPYEEQEPTPPSLIIAATLLLRIPVLQPSSVSSTKNNNSTNRHTRTIAPPTSNNIAKQLSEWLDHHHHHNSTATATTKGNANASAQQQQRPPTFASSECLSDLQYLQDFRQRMMMALQHTSRHVASHGTIRNLQPFRTLMPSSSSTAATVHSQRTLLAAAAASSTSSSSSVSSHAIELLMTGLQNYAAVLQEFIHRGFPSNDREGIGFLSCTWQCPLYNTNDTDDTTDTDTYSTTTTTLETHHSLAWERVNVLYNIAVLYTYRAAAELQPERSSTTTPHATTTTTTFSGTVATTTTTSSPMITRAQYTKAGQYLQNAATMIRYIRQMYFATASNVLDDSDHALSSHHHTGGTVPQNHVWHTSVLLCNSSFCEVLQLHLLAEAQRMAYQTFVIPTSSSSSSGALEATTSASSDTNNSLLKQVNKQNKPKHFVLAKLAAAAAPLYIAVEDLCQEYCHHHQNSDLHATTATTDHHDGEIHSNSNTVRHSEEDHLNHQWTTTQFIQEWDDSVRAFGMFMTALAEYHQSHVHRERTGTKEHGYELSRLEGAIKFAEYCRDFCDSTTFTTLRTVVQQQVIPLLQEMEERYDVAKSENEKYHHEAIPDHDDLPEIAQVLSVKTDIVNISKLLPALNCEPILFANVLDPKLRTYVDLFRSKAQNVIVQTEQLADRQTEVARSQLAAIQLPHAITSYQQEQNGGGIPDEIWDQIVHVQQTNTVDQLSRDTWSIQAYSDTSRVIMEQISNVLTSDLDMDTIFRQDYPNFEGHSVREIQKLFRQAIQNYQTLLDTAQESDRSLLNRCKLFTTDPKFRLLKLQKVQLDRLLPPISPTENTNSNTNTYDITVLSNFLVDLSTLFNERDTIMHRLKEHSKTYNVGKDLATIGPHSSEDIYKQLTDMALTSLQPIVNEMSLNLEKQGKLLFKIKNENEQFMKARDYRSQRRKNIATAASSSTSNLSNDVTIVKIYNALDEIESFSTHIKEGRNFYDIVIPKLEKLLHQVEDVSTRLAKERMDYEKYTSRLQQRSIPEENVPAPDRQSTRYLLGAGNGEGQYMSESPYNDIRQSRRQIRSTPPYNMDSDRLQQQQRRLDDELSRPGGQSMLGGRPDIRVDDEKVANLISMDFDPGQAVAALKRHNNDLELALNDLLAA